ncbi:hypothetical protein BDV35DRAFT_341518 [Aspergillus flavus]|uniref:Uncharacterized protein n=1 Tax=Aspergillus flavus TaxID=5059 RepID=A0A5N6H8G9_ASPFL|nr:hypothetical protein BDV35DRAFT_341518 [Aspergillus flavus]
MFFLFSLLFSCPSLFKTPKVANLKSFDRTFGTGTLVRGFSFLRAEQTGTFVHMRPETSDKWTFHTPALAEYANYSRFYQAFPFSSGS